MPHTQHVAEQTAVPTAVPIPTTNATRTHHQYETNENDRRHLAINTQQLCPSSKTMTVVATSMFDAQPLIETLGQIPSQAAGCIDSIKRQAQQVQIDRPTITVSFLSALAIFLLFTASSFSLIALLTAPIWIPISVITSPIWIPVGFVTSPIWIAAISCALAALAIAISVVLFFTWPSEWLPNKDHSAVTATFLNLRDSATQALIKMQAKIVLYTAGIGPLADAAFVVLDRISIEEIQKALQDFDVSEFTAKASKMEFSEIFQSLMNTLKTIATPAA